MRRRLVPIVAVFAVLAALPALFVPASATQIAAFLGLSDSAAPGAPTAVQPYPVLGGIGVTWAPPAGDPPTSYEVERRRPSGNWGAESGRLTAATTRWVDNNVQPDATVEYRVLAIHGDGTAVPSDPITAHRVATDPAVGTVDMLLVDADRGGAVTWLTDELAKPVTAAPLSDGNRTLSAGTLQFTLPGILPGPGEFAVGGTSGRALEVQQKDGSCSLTGTLTLDEIAYTPELEIATMAGRFAGSCEGASSVAGELRVNSAKLYAAVSVPPVVDFGRVDANITSVTKQTTVTNTGLVPISVTPQPLTGDTTAWSTSNQCGTLQPDTSCTVSVTFNPQRAQNYSNDLSIGSTTPVRTTHQMRFTASAVTTPSMPTGVAAHATFTGIDLSWTPPFDGNSPITEYVVRRDRANEVTTFRLPATQLHWSEQGDTNAAYTVAAVNDVGEGRLSERTTPTARFDQITVFNGPKDQPATLGGISLPRGTEILPMGQEPPSGLQADITSSPDGGAVAYAVADGSSRTLSVRRGDSAGAFTTTKLLTAPGIKNLAWSPDGTRIAFTATDGSNTCVDLIDVASHTVVRVGCSIDIPAWHPDNRSLIVKDKRVTGAPLARVEAKANGARLGVLAGSTGIVQTAVSPAGSWLAFILSSGKLGLLPVDGGTPKVLPDSQVAGISWAVNGYDLAVLVRSATRDSIVRLKSVSGMPYVTSELIYEGVAGEQISDFVWQGIGTVIAPTPGLLRSSVSIPFDATAVQSIGTSCSIDGDISQPCTSPFTASGLATGKHQLDVYAYIPSGFGSIASRVITVDASGPVSRVVAPTYAATTDGSASVQISATDAAGVASYDVRYRRAPFNGPYGAFSQPWSGITSTTVNLPLASGYEYCVSVRAKDKFGNVGAWSAERCFARPTDDRSLTAATPGWTRANWSAFYLGTATHTTTYGASLTRTVQGKRFYVLATKCPTCGTAAVYLGTRYIGAVNLYSTTTQRQVLIALPAQTTLFSGTLKLTSRTAGRLVQIDGLAVRRT